MPEIRDRDEENNSRKKRLAKLKRGPGVFAYDGSFFHIEHTPTPKLTGAMEAVFDGNGLPVSDRSGRQVFQRKGEVVTDDRGNPVMGGVPKVTKTPAKSWTIRGVTFPEGEPVAVSDAALALKLRGMNGFEELEGEAAESVRPVAPKKRGRPRKAQDEGEA